MSDAITIEINTPDNTRRAISACKDKQGLGRRLAAAMDRENELSVKRIQHKLTGDVLIVRTGLLRKSIGRTRALVLDEEVQSSVGSGALFGGNSVSYAAFWEFGFTGTESVKEHLSRRSSEGRIFFGRKKMVFKSTSEFTVRAHTRKVSQAPRSFIGSTIADRAPDYGTALTDAATDFLGGDA